MMAKKPTVADAQLIIQLYDLRRETEMRKARNWWANEFFPQSADDFLQVAWAMGTQENAWLRQVGGYWGIVASFVLKGVLNEELFLQPGFSGELFLIYAKIHPFIKELREKLSDPQAFLSLEKAVTRTKWGRGRLEVMMKSVETLRQRAAHRKATSSRLAASVILVGCADDLVVSDPGRQYPGRSVRGHRVVYPLAPSPA